MREYPVSEAGGTCAGCGAALASGNVIENTLEQPQSSAPDQNTERNAYVKAAPALQRKNRAPRYIALASLLLVLMIAGFGAVLYLQEPVLVEQVLKVEEPVQLQGPEELEESEAVSDRQITQEHDENIRFFYETYTGEMNFLLNVIEHALDGDLDMELEEFYDWFEEEDVILSQYDEILRRYEEQGGNLDWLPEWTEPFAQLEELLNTDFLAGVLEDQQP